MDKIHFVRLDRYGDYHEFSLIHYLCIKSFAVNHPGAEIFIHQNRSFYSKWFSLLDSEIGNRLTLVNYVINDWDIYDCVSHRCDRIKLDIAKDYGGLIVDSDFLCLKPCDQLIDLNHKINICEERDPVTHKFVQLVIGLMYASDCKFIDEWIEAYNHYEKGKDWTYYAGQVPTKLWKSGKYDKDINIIPESLIDPFSYTRDGMADLFLHNYDVPYAYMVHTAESVVWDRFLKPLDLEHIMTVNTTFTKLARPYVEHLWDKSNNKSLFR